MTLNNLDNHEVEVSLKWCGPTGFTTGNTVQNFVNHNSQVESLILIGISTLGKHSTFLGTLPLLTGIQFCGGVLLVPVTLCIFGLTRKEREFLTTRKYFLALILAYAIILGVQVCHLDEN